MTTLKSPLLFSLMLMALFAASLTPRLQAQPVVAGGAVAFTPEGVWVDAKGVINVRDKLDPAAARALKQRLRNQFTEDNLAFISLPKYFAEVQKMLKDGKSLPDHLKYLGGMTRIQYIMVDTENGDLIIAGPQEEIDLSNPHRPLGKSTGWPVLQLDDLVLTLRMAQGRHGNGFGCTIELKSNASKAMLEAFEKNKHLVRKGQKAKVAELMAEAGGHQPISFFNMAGNSRYANVAVEADYRMKRLALGLDKSPVRAVPSYIKLLRGPAPMQNRFWLELNPREIQQANDGSIYKLEGNTLRISTAPVGLPQYTTKASPAAVTFARKASDNFEALARHLPSFADLSNLADLSIVASLIFEDQLDTKVNWDKQWLMNPKGDYQVKQYVVPTQAPCLVNHYPGGGGVMFAAGGVLLSPGKAIQLRQKVERATLEFKAKPLAQAK